MDVAIGIEYLHGKNIVHFDLRFFDLRVIICLVNFWDQQRPICKIRNHKEMLNKKSSKFVFRRKKLVGIFGQGSLDCAISLSDEHGEKGEKLETCKHLFHENCLEKWLMQKDIKATCPLSN
ncbi:uncharacterized protein LOC132048854 [Lycium ferocissimum]|uniref:uncharacterized protein LOC132048854 n=1 Tax=Lycium ferocissimum TaxID=112874 RepID=UPI00281678E2|nr:uncharacterized protein LOC132048854 [Lycium ferocissimum]